MTTASSPPVGPASLTAFLGHQRIAEGSRAAVTRALRREVQRGLAADTDAPPLLVFDDASGAPVELDLRSGMDAPAPAPVAEAAPPAPGRPKLGVVAREVTLLPQHWEWLALQPGGASVALRKLVHAAQRVQPSQDGQRAAQERCYLFLRAIAGNLPGYEEALRALFRGDAAAFDAAAAGWPPDILAHARLLSAGAFVAPDEAPR
ncbi:DUF2239 family protein [Pseudorhodoferax sp. Leaf274]|uniref:DUF2239 family protein n=1 Tax=Pseudorhodoferax sp. Leaf274 TaxID=1736318 RepID=UPI00070256AD|nr:DUF2239 family protein [Pseudorhodoferax sp. Leaf274]KQP49797.1 hypothetical protein ASF44_04260 [Pseudorhodoferax sp. Leaf274]